MCLFQSDNQKQQFIKRHKNKSRIVVWKMITTNVDQTQYITVFQQTKISGGWLKAIPHLKTQPFYLPITDGAIHVYLTRYLARANISYYDGKVIRCEALMKDLIGVGHDSNGIPSAAFTKIWIPKSQLPPIKRKKS